MDDVKVEADGLECRSEGTLGCGVAIATFGRTFATPDFDYLQVDFKWRKRFLESLFKNPRRGHIQLISFKQVNPHNEFTAERDTPTEQPSI